MANLNVSASYLEGLARELDKAAEEADGAASAADGIATNCWLTHGVMSGSSNGEIQKVENRRKSAGKAIRQGCVDLAAKLRTAKAAYTGVDEDLSKNMNTQVLPQ